MHSCPAAALAAFICVACGTLGSTQDGGGPAAEGATPDGAALDASAPDVGACDPLDHPPYASPPYAGVHAGPGNNDLVACTAASAYAERWHALKGLGVAQPNTFSPDGATIYVTTTQPTPEVCSLHALDAATGEVHWCKAILGAVGAAADVDTDGNLYVAATGAVRSFRPDGTERWTFTLDAVDGEAAYGSHFGAAGLLVTATSAGRLLLLDRADGHAAASMDLLTTFGLARPAPGTSLNLRDLLPEAVRIDMERVYGQGGALLSVLGGAGAGYTDNTVAIGPDGTIYAIGWGVAAGKSAVVQVHVDVTPNGVSLRPGWRLDAVQNSASSPSVSPDGHWLKIEDGNTAAALLAPQAFPATARLADVSACDGNTDADPDPAVCEPALVLPLASGPALGASPVLDDAEHYLWDVQLATLTRTENPPDVSRYAGDTLVWATDLPEGAAFTSVLTLTRDAILGTMTRVTAGGTKLVGVALPETAESELVVLDRETGAVRFHTPVSDDSTATVTIGPDGALYANLLGLVSAFAVQTEIVGGVVRFDPQQAGP